MAIRINHRKVLPEIHSPPSHIQLSRLNVLLLAVKHICLERFAPFIDAFVSFNRRYHTREFIITLPVDITLVSGSHLDRHDLLPAQDLGLILFELIHPYSKIKALDSDWH